MFLTTEKLKTICSIRKYFTIKIKACIHISYLCKSAFVSALSRFGRKRKPKQFDGFETAEVVSSEIAPPSPIKSPRKDPKLGLRAIVRLQRCSELVSRLKKASPQKNPNEVATRMLSVARNFVGKKPARKC
jgi:hypothetical protein